eukprot:scaffold182778_cov42-Cyclotella_meneghiniana.AAC.1
MRFGLECFASNVLHGLNFELWEGKKPSCGPPSEQGQVSDCLDHNIQTIAAGPSQCLIVDVLNDVMQFGMECFASNGLHVLNFELWEAAGPSQCLIVDVFNDVMQFGMECFASNGLHGLNFELWEVWIGMLCQQWSPPPRAEF